MQQGIRVCRRDRERPSLFTRIQRGGRGVIGLWDVDRLTDGYSVRITNGRVGVEQVLERNTKLPGDAG
jgi:hypothetical protein